MSIYCGCDFEEPGSYYSLPGEEHQAESKCRCYGCGDDISIGDEVRHIFEYTLDENESDYKKIGEICEKCSGHYDRLTELGFCLASEFGFISEALKEYIEDYK